MAAYRFEEVAIVGKDKKKPTDADKTTYIGLEHLSSDTFEVEEYGSEVAPKGEKLVMRKGDVLFGKRRAYQKKVGIAPCDGIFSAHGMVLRPNEKVVDAHFFPFFIRSDAFLDEAIRISVGSLSPTVNWRDLKELEFELPSLDKQRELAELLWAAEETKWKYRKLIQTSDDIVKSRFVEMFGDGEGCQIVELQSVCSLITDGTHQPPKFVREGIPFLLVSNIANNEMTYDTEKYITRETYEQLIKRTPIEVGDLLVSAVGSFGHPAIIRDDRPFCFQRHIAYFKPIREKIDSIYLHALLLMDDAQTYMDRYAKGVAQRTVTLKSFKEMPILLPPLGEQQAFASFVQQVDKSKVALQQSLDELNATMTAILNEELGTRDV